MRVAVPPLKLENASGLGIWSIILNQSRLLWGIKALDLYIINFPLHHSDSLYTPTWKFDQCATSQLSRRNLQIFPEYCMKLEAYTSLVPLSFQSCSILAKQLALLQSWYIKIHLWWKNRAFYLFFCRNVWNLSKVSPKSMVGSFAKSVTETQRFWF